MTVTEIFLTVGDEVEKEKENDGKNAEEEKNEEKDEKDDKNEAEGEEEEKVEKVEKKRKKKVEGEALRKSPRKQASRASKPKYSLV